MSSDRLAAIRTRLDGGALTEMFRDRQRGMNNNPIYEVGYAACWHSWAYDVSALLAELDAVTAVRDEEQAELRRQWENNHAEMCGALHGDDGHCFWPRPVALAGE